MSHSFRSCFCWLYRASSSLAAKNIINLILVLTIWWCPCVESSLVLLEEGVCYDQCVLLAKLYEPLFCFILYSKAKFAGLELFQVFLDFLLLHSSLLSLKGYLLGLLVLKPSWSLSIFFFRLRTSIFTNSHSPANLFFYWLPVCL